MSENDRSTQGLLWEDDEQSVNQQDPAQVTEFRTIPGLDGYCFGDDGSCWSKRISIHKSKYDGGGSISAIGDKWKWVKGSVEKKNGYVVVWIDGKHIMLRRLILAAFKGPCPKGMRAVSINGNNTDDRLSNIDWVSIADRHRARFPGKPSAGVWSRKEERPWTGNYRTLEKPLYYPPSSGVGPGIVPSNRDRIPNGFRLCNTCKAIKPIAEFYPTQSHIKKDGISRRCIECERSCVQERYCNSPSYRQMMIKNARVQKLRGKYNISIEEYNRLLASQGGCCAICGTERNQGKNKISLDVDHDHSTGRVRGILCNRCNSAIGALGDSIDGLQRAIDYLKQTAGIATQSSMSICYKDWWKDL
jgi:hypothetical protein